MSYSVIGIIAILVHLIINRDMLRHSKEHTDVPACREYRDYIFGMLLFCVTDVMWGFLNDLRLITPLYAVTDLFFVTMMAGFLLWTRYVAAYMEGQDHSIFRKILLIAGIVMFGCEILILIINFFVPIQFRFDENGNYQAGGARYVTLAMQMALFLLTSVYTFVTKSSDEKVTKRLHRSVGLFGLLMTALIIVQLFYPLLPLYSIGFLLSSCMLHSFIVEDEKDEYRKSLEEMLLQTQQQSAELGTARKKIYTDPLTGVKSKHAYMDDTEKIYQRIRGGNAGDFAVVVFDVNDLKRINDTKGHDAGDVCIYSAAMLIGEFFAGSPVYRIGGDEFAVILKGDDYANRRQLLTSFNAQAENSLCSDRVVVAAGMAEYRKGSDRNYRTVFDRADKKMYQRKRELKEIQRKRMVPA